MTNIVISEDNKEELIKKYQKIISKFQKNQYNNRIIIYIDRLKLKTNKIEIDLIYTTNFNYYQ